MLLQQADRFWMLSDYRQLESMPPHYLLRRPPNFGIRYMPAIPSANTSARFMPV